ncbi:hypothetical protein [Arthrobacter sp. NEB 688]|uniref:hypothetical protein n=1 Tax=Arthrobacter sp. NEB 688 TaxID=904039 RepID=UPI001564CE6F|nr:hypothetical protein [Arthrobacter sp. NEB 688]QKE82884.1 hypothetical protein HL663_02240 [Arthrobacter sp. NEB 688]
MTTHHDPGTGCAPHDVLNDLLTIGSDRAAEEHAGGPALAAFADSCWHLDIPLDSDHFQLWLDSLADAAYSSADLTLARRALKGLS